MCFPSQKKRETPPPPSPPFKVIWIADFWVCYTTLRFLIDELENANFFAILALQFFLPNIFGVLSGWNEAEKAHLELLQNVRTEFQLSNSI